MNVDGTDEVEEEEEEEEEEGMWAMGRRETGQRERLGPRRA